MGEYMLGVSFACLLVSFASFVSVAEVGRGATRFALGVILAAALIAPISGLVTNIGSALSDIKDTEYTDDGKFSEYTERAFCEGIRLAVADKFSVSPDGIYVIALEFDASNMRAELVKITLSGSAATADYRAIRAYVEESNLGKCEVEITFDG
jgi:hypothetical protein